MRVATGADTKALRIHGILDLPRNSRQELPPQLRKCCGSSSLGFVGLDAVARSCVVREIHRNAPAGQCPHYEVLFLEVGAYIYDGYRSSSERFGSKSIP